VSGVVAISIGSFSNTHFFFFLFGFASIDNLQSHYILYIDGYLLVTILETTIHKQRQLKSKSTLEIQINLQSFSWWNTYLCKNWSLEPIMTFMMLIIRMILCVTHNDYNLNNIRECFKRNLGSLSSLTFYCNLESWDLINLSWTLKGFCKSIIFQGKKKKKHFSNSLMSLAFWYPCI
jgi:hypothetical protein